MMAGLVSTITNGRLRFIALVERFARDRRGVGAVEFAIVFPILLALYLTSFELTIGYNTYKRASSASATINDLISKTNSVDKAYMTSMQDVTAAVFAPYSTKGLQTENQRYQDRQAETGDYRLVLEREKREALCGGIASLRSHTFACSGQFPHPCRAFRAA